MELIKRFKVFCTVKKKLMHLIYTAVEVMDKHIDDNLH